MSGVRLVKGPVTEDRNKRIIANSETIQSYDFVTLDGDGFLKRTAAGEKIEGIFMEANVTVASDNETVDQVEGEYWPIHPSMEFEMTADQACTDTDVGAYADIVLSTNEMQVDLAAGANGQLEVINYDADTTTLVRVKVAEPQRLGFTQD